MHERRPHVGGGAMCSAPQAAPPRAHPCAGGWCTNGTHVCWWQATVCWWHGSRYHMHCQLDGMCAPNPPLIIVFIQGCCLIPLHKYVRIPLADSGCRTTAENTVLPQHLGSPQEVMMSRSLRYQQTVHDREFDICLDIKGRCLLLVIMPVGCYHTRLIMRARVPSRW